MDYIESKHRVVRGIGLALVAVLAGCLWLAERIYGPLYQHLDHESLNGETLCYLIDLEGGEGCL